MKAFEDIFEGIKDRFRNPFIFSFISGWLVVNWKVIIALMYYNVSPVNEANIEKLLGYLSQKTNTCNSFWWPLVIGLGYTFLMPIFRNVIRVFNSWVNQNGEDWVLDVTKSGQMPVSKFLKLRKEYREQTDELRKLNDSESETRENLISTKNDLNNAREKIQELQRIIEEKGAENQQLTISETSLMKDKEQLNKQIVKQNQTIGRLESASNLQMINGRWINSFEINGVAGTEEIEIEDGKYFVITKRGRDLVFEISCFSYDVGKNRLSFLKINQKMTKPFESAVPNRAADISTIRSKYLFNELRFFENKTVMMGAENGTNKVRYTRTGDLATEVTK